VFAVTRFLRNAYRRRVPDVLANTVTGQFAAVYPDVLLTHLTQFVGA